MAAIPAEMSRIGKPLNDFGESASFKRSRTPAKITIAIVKPIAAENPNTTLFIKLYSLSIFTRAEPRTAQFVVISGR